MVCRIIKRSAGVVRCASAFADDAFVAPRARCIHQLRRRPTPLRTESHVRLSCAACENLSQRRPPPLERQRANVHAVVRQQIECPVPDPLGRFFGDSALQRLKGRVPAVTTQHNLTIHHDVPSASNRDRAFPDRLEPIGPVKSIACQQHTLPGADVTLHAIPIEFRLVQPIRARWHRCHAGRELWRNESGSACSSRAHDRLADAGRTEQPRWARQFDTRGAAALLRNASSRLLHRLALRARRGCGRFLRARWLAHGAARRSP